ncbi:MAG: type II toxin-antitoxin system RelE/ParE family toxin [Flavisolibacter sp.]
MYQLILSPEAQQDIEEATDYYITVSYATAEKFIDTLEELYKKLERSPQHFSFVDKQRKLRSISFTAFPYSVIFQIIQNTVYVFAVFNTEQDPDKLFKRIK